MDQTATILPETAMTRKAAWLHAFSTFNYIDDRELRERGVSFVKAAIERGELRMVAKARRGKFVITP